MSKSRLIGLTNRALMLIAAGLLVFSYLSILVNPAKMWLVSVAGILFVPLSLINLILLVWAILRRSKAFVIPLLAMLPAVFFIGRYVQSGNRETIAEGSSENTIKVISWNVGRFAYHSDVVDGFEECVDSVFRYLKEQDADVICLQEMYVRDSRKMKEYFGRKMKGYAAEYYMFPGRKGSFGNVTLSRLPVRNRGKVKFDESANLAIFTDYESFGKVFRVYNCHFESYNISVSGIIRGMLDAESDIIAETGTKMKRSITRRPKQVDQVFSDIENCPVEAFVCGDFNDNPMSYTYYRMMRDRKDAFVEAGEGFGATYARLWPLLRIDYVLCPKSCNVLEHDIPRIELSDHYPVITEIAL